MDAPKILEVVARYRRHFEEKGISPVRIPDNCSPEVTSEEQLAHAYWMLDEIEKFAREREPRLGKAFRWLGFVQGVLFVTGEFTIIDLRSHNRS
ncbi:MAG: hypothetical protein ABH837_03550 [bacterium]